jgi:ribosomal protein L24E
MDDVRVFGYCENCGDKITDSSKEYYVSDDGKVFCCCECAMEHLGVVKIEV